MSKPWMRPAGLLCLMIPTAAWADLSGIATVPANSSLNLATGAVAASGGDLRFTGTTFVAQTGAGAVDTGNVQLAGFNYYTLAVLQANKPGLSNLPVTPAPQVGDVIVVLTTGGLYAKVLVTALSGASTTLQYYTYGAASAPAGPAITGVQNNYSYLLPGMPNYGIAPGTLFIVTGSDLANPGAAVLQSSGGSGIPATLNGASITVTVNGVVTHPGMYYAIPTQIAGVLPSSTPAGTGTITVTYGGVTSSTAPITVVATALGFDTYYGSGSGLVAAIDPNSPVGALFTYANSARPGQAIELFGSGLGADPADSDTVYTSPPHSINVPLTIYVGGIQAQILYQGGSGYPGLNQIDVVIPPGVTTGCGVSIVGVSDGLVSNTVSIPVMPNGGSCFDTVIGQVNVAGVGVNGNFGNVQVVQETGAGYASGSASADFSKVSGLAGAGGLYTLGDCAVAQAIQGAGTGATITGLNAGTVSVSGPAGTLALPAVPSLPGDYSAVTPTGFMPASGGTFTFTGTGGADVGPFTASVSYSNPPVWTNMNADTTVTRSQGVTITWTGGFANGYILITGTSTSPAVGANGSVSAGFNCYVASSAGTFTVPNYVLLGLPAGTGSITLEAATTPAPFTANGINYGTGLAAIILSNATIFQ